MTRATAAYKANFWTAGISVSEPIKKQLDIDRLDNNMEGATSPTTRPISIMEEMKETIEVESSKESQGKENKEKVG